MQTRFTEQETERYYDEEDATYRAFWDSEGSLHWGIFDESTGADFLKASANLNRIMLEKSRIGAGAKALDFGCGNGNTAIWLCRQCQAEVVGVDLSGVRISNARDSASKLPSEVAQKLHFEKASVTALPFESGSFTHVWSQATIYHVPDKDAALREAYRVLGSGGIFIFDDLVKPKSNISQESKKYVYDRLMFDTNLTFLSYQDTLRDKGFTVLEAHDLSQHLKTSYVRLSEIAASVNEGDTDRIRALSLAYTKMVQAVEEGDLGWGLYVCQK